MTTRVSAPVRIDISGGWPDSDPYRKDFGGYVLNAAINLRVSGYLDDSNLTTSLGEVPRSSGLGTSGALRAVYLAAANTNLIKDKKNLIQRVHKFENEVIGHRAGFQDEAAAIYGGLNLWEFNTNDSIRREQIYYGSQDLENKLILVYTGKTHLSSNLHDNVFGPKNYDENIPKLDRMKEISKDMARSIKSNGDITDLVKETWELQRSLDKSIETELMKDLIEDITYFFPCACKATGAGGGGCLIIYSNDERNKSLIENRLIKRYQDKNPGFKIIPFKFDYNGLKIEED
ncbi:MAG: hypothetical protein WC867_06500 [Candidatus Pacearchaeota archaeon]|jgi:D-glycero-alpha-D-manno-heptose-7-phosphate kinase